MNDLYIVPVSVMLILLGGRTFSRLTAVSSSGPAFLVRRSGRIALIGILSSVSFALLIPPVYAWVEGFSALPNGTDVISKCFTLVAIALLGRHLSLAYGATSALRWNTGTRGAIAISAAALGLLITTVLADAPDPSPQLAAYTDQLPVGLNTGIMVTWIAYIVTPLVVPIAKDARHNPVLIGRWGSGLIATGFALSTLRALMYFPLELPLGPDAFLWFMLISYASMACVVFGLWSFAISNRQKLPSKTLKVSLSID